ncbi:hypothetical protein [Legionella tunisiensis]|uniref:hypothetical protein n=1 Tax=Legionella tunisiensis TaxID=1034944 RepID=UPI0003825AD3|nr:hypothetical protein [Legionella tunisiensis]
MASEQRKAGQAVDVHFIVANTIYTIPTKVAKDTAIVLNCAGSFQVISMQPKQPAFGFATLVVD